MKNRTRRDLLLTGAALTAGMMSPWAARSQESESALYEGAKKEGSVVFYGGITPNAQSTLKERFEKKYPGVTVELLYLSGAPMMTRIMTEARANRHLADTLMFDAVRFKDLYKAGLLARFAPSSDKYDASWHSNPPGYWIQPFSYLACILYNKRLVPKEQIPTSFQDLLKPEFKGRISMVTPTNNELTMFWAAGLIRDLGEGKAFEYFRGLVEQKVVIFGPGATRIAQGVANGEFAAGIAFATFAYSMNEKDTMGLAPTKPLYQVSGPGVAVMERAPHPEAARLLANFILSAEGQDVFVELGNFTNLRGARQQPLLANLTYSAAPIPEGAAAAALQRKLVDVFGR